MDGMLSHEKPFQENLRHRLPSSRQVRSSRSRENRTIQRGFSGHLTQLLSSSGLCRVRGQDKRATTRVRLYSVAISSSGLCRVRVLPFLHPYEL